MSNATLATIKNVNALLAGTSIAPIVIPATEPTAPAARWQDRPASKKQVNRIVEMAALKGKHTMSNVKTGEKMPINEANVATISAGLASKLYQALKGLPTIQKENVTVKPATIAPIVTVKEARKAQREARKAARKARKAIVTPSPIDWDTDGMDDLGYAEGDTASVIIHALDTKLYA